MAAILLVEDDPHLRYGVQWNLEREGHRVTAVERGEEALLRFARESFELVLLDLMLPGISGFDVLRAVRERSATVPVLVLSARADEADAVTALGLGADDYVRKPFGLSELLARIAAVQRRLGARAERPTLPELPTLGEWTLDLANLVARGPRGEQSLTTIEAELLSALLAKRGELCRREELLQRIWGAPGTTLTRTLDNHVARLRKKLECDPADPRCIVTVHGAGYTIPRDGAR
jgi:two-component system alkaline phosphatase synthesis response regulator PhoP/two-component system response regulator VicR